MFRKSLPLTIRRACTKPEYISKCLSSTSAYPVSFSRAGLGTFFQEEPVLHNEYISNPVLPKFLKRKVPADVLKKIEPDLQRFGARVATELYQLSRECEENPPSLMHFDAWGKRKDRLVTSAAWKKMKTVAAEEGLIAIAYERSNGEWSRLHQLIKNFLFMPSSGLYSCPLAMTDGAAKSIEALKLEGFELAFQNLISRDPKKFWTSGQWMTEKKGGSDVAGGTETIAVLQKDGSYRLYGYKWFSSANDSDMTFTLARTVDPDGTFTPGTRGLSMFYLETKQANGDLNNIEIVKLKNKLGTRQLPTAELLLDGAIAHKVSEEGRGVAAISNMLTVTRIHNALSSSSSMRRILSLARDYATKREAFGRKLCEHPLHMQTLARMEVEVRGCELITFETARLLGLDDANLLTEEEGYLLRLLTPVIKLYTGKQAVPLLSEGLESFGGQGYIEDTGLPSLLRDAQVTPIWEGTTNILSLDVLRAAGKTKGNIFNAFHSSISKKLETAKGITELKSSVDVVHRALESFEKFIGRQTPANLELAARDLSFSIAKIFIGSLLLEHASWTEATEIDVAVAKRWCQQDLSLVDKQSINDAYSSKSAEENGSIVMEGYLQ